ncbi:MAG: 50S ribosomal protein L11 methyltransferase, partial [Clostridia bacterium]|nr:50S ribosomal protein L11 methyltransferase [Clostridia bacterium]
MKYTQITVKTTSQASELVAYYLQEVCLDGVSIYDKADLYSSSWDYVEENFVNNYDQEVIVSGYCEKENTDSVLCFLRNAFLSMEGQDAGSLAISTQEVEGDEWL